MTMLKRFRPALLTIPVVAVLGVASAILFHSLETDRLAERARQEQFMRNAALSVLDDLGAELFSMYSAFSLDLYSRSDSGNMIDRQVLAAAIERYQRQARFPDLLQDLTCMIWENGSFRYWTWTDQGWGTNQKPDWVPELLVASSAGPGKIRGRSSFSLGKPVLIIPLKTRKPLSGEVVVVALRFSARTVLEQVVPALVNQRFSESQGALPYKASIRDRSLGTADQAAFDWEVPLLPWTPFEGWFDYHLSRLKTLEGARGGYDRFAETISERSAMGTGWSLTVVRLPFGLEAEMQGLWWRNWALSAVFFLVLTAGFLGLFRALLQERRFAEQERTFLALISHELKTPVSVVRSLADNLVRGIGADERRAREYGAVLQEESDRLARMISNVLVLTAVQGGISPHDRCAIDLESLVRERVARQPPVEGVDLQVHIDPAVVSVLGHPAALAAAIDNLVANAYRHGTSNPGPHCVRIAVEPRRRYGRRGVEFSVEDDGPGFTRAEGRAFLRPFHRGQRAQESQAPGGGVGLSLIWATARALGGALSWTSAPGKGARFRLWLRQAPS